MTRACILCLFILSNSLLNAQWVDFCTKPAGTVVDLVFYEDTLYAAGTYPVICGDAAPYLSKWNGLEWETVDPMFSDEGHRMEVIDDALYITKYQFGSDSNWLFKYDGTTFSKVGAGFNIAGTSASATASMYDVIKYDGNVVVCGEFNKYAGNPISAGVASWNGNTWESLGDGLTGSISTSPSPLLFPHQLFEFEGDLLVAGNFSMADGMPASGIARWNGTAWSAMGAGFNNTVYALEMHDGELYAGGGFTALGDGTIMPHIAKWNGTDWVSANIELGQSTLFPMPYVHTISSIGGSMYIGGVFDKVTYDGTLQSCKNVIAFEGDTINLMGGGKDMDVEAFLAYDDELLVGGGIFTDGFLSIYNLPEPPSGINPLELNRLEIWPNPAIGMFNLRADEVEWIKLFDLTGREVNIEVSAQNKSLFQLHVAQPGEFVVLVKSADGFQTNLILIK